MTTPDSGVRLSRAHRWLAPVSLVIVAMAAVMGWAASFVGLHDYGHTDMVGFTVVSAWLLPATFDGAAFACTLMTYRASINGRSALRGRILMWAFTGVSAWINWIHQPSLETRLVAAGLPVAAVAVFDVVLCELRADYEARHGRTGFRLRPGLLLLRWLVDPSGTTAAFRKRITSIPVPTLVGPTESTPSTENTAPAPDSTEPVPETTPKNSADTAPTETSPEGERSEPAPVSESGDAPAAGVSLPPVRPSSVKLPDHVLHRLSAAREHAYRTEGRSLTAADVHNIVRLPEALTNKLVTELALPDTHGHALV
ncbi:DUF2637 domain-containing protein [Actinopolyspora mortivallis]|uniref:DUF2637 domain-containing protein n=1 Tax=Actinopolyspora mortivallis TaxID=33906 RepID=A0A2T0GSC6_ACTMO|nr:DUF2637 domain-containing protein [Actinopolyspora mortivallis]PRW61997.1 hypothetical protein CEP50_17810 [Actinopolyspora mortivallis]